MAGKTFTAHNEEAPYVVRPSTSADEPVLIALAQAEDMTIFEGFEATLVAEDSTGSIAGFCRIRVYNEESFVNPLVVSPAFRKCGVGKLLMKEASQRWGTLKFVARGSAVPFYTSIGSIPVPWESIAPEVADDCNGCAQLEHCHPLPMSYRA